MSKYGVTVRGMGVALPDTVVSNEEISTLVDTSDEWIVSRTGFKNRHVLAGDEKLTDLALKAVHEALAYSGIPGEEIDLIIYACSTPDNIYPAGCCVIQHAIGAKNAMGFDMSMACSGLIYAMGIAKQFIENGTATKALIIGADAHSRYTDWYDRNTCVLFGDAVGCFVLSRKEAGEPSDIIAMDMRLDGSRSQDLTLPVDRKNCPLVEQKGEPVHPYVYMNGREVFKFAVGDVPMYIEETLKKAGMTTDDIDYFILHQANYRIMKTLSEKMNLKPEQVVVSLENYGNTSAATIPLALNDALKDGRVKPGSTLLLCGFGAGFAVATSILKWSCVDQRGANVAQTTASNAV